jgi:hypothetical protein
MVFIAALGLPRSGLVVVVGSFSIVHFCRQVFRDFLADTNQLCTVRNLDEDSFREWGIVV